MIDYSKTALRFSYQYLKLLSLFVFLHFHIPVIQKFHINLSAPKPCYLCLRNFYIRFKMVEGRGCVIKVDLLDR